MRKILLPYENEVRLMRQRDRFAALLSMANRLAQAAPDVQIEADNGEIVDGRWLSAQIQSALWEESPKPADRFGDHG